MPETPPRVPGPSSRAAPPAAQVLEWLHREFVALRTSVDAAVAEVGAHGESLNELLAGQVALRASADSAAGELAVSLAELEGYAADLRKEMGRLAEVQNSVARSLPDLVRGAVAEEMERGLDDLRRPEPKPPVALGRPDGRLEDERLRRLVLAAVLEALPGLASAVSDELRRQFPPPKPRRERQSDPSAPSERLFPADTDGGDPPEEQEADSEVIEVILPADPSVVAVGQGGDDAGDDAEIDASGGGGEPGLDADFGPLGEGTDPPDTYLRAHGPVPLAIATDMVVGPGTAEIIGRSLELARLRRRRRRRAGIPAPGLVREDQFTSPTLAVLARFDHDHSSGRFPLSSAGQKASGNGSEKGGTRVSAVPFGYCDDVEITLDFNRWPAVTLAGAGAGDAARAVLTAFVALSPGRGGALVVGPPLVAGLSFAGFDQPASIGAALDDLAQAVADRVPSGGPVENRNQLLVVASDLEPSAWPRLRSLIRRGRGHGVFAIIVNDDESEREDETESEVARIVVDQFGQVASATPARLATVLNGAHLFRLGPESCPELLSVVAAGRTDADHLRALPVAPPTAFAPPGGTGPVEVSLLGPFRIVVNGEEVRHGLRDSAREVLAYTLVHPEGVPVDKLLDDIWPGLDPGQARELFQAAVANLRFRFESATGSKGLVVVDLGPLVRPEALFDVDLWQLHRSMEAASSVSRSRGPAARLTAFDGAAQIYRGELLADCDWLWVRPARDDLRQRIVDVLVWLADSRWAAGDTTGAAETLARAVELDPFAEQLYRRLMRLHARRSGRRELEATYRQLQDQLASVGLEPSAESTKLRFEL